MALTIKGEDKEGFPEHGWGIISEVPGKASTEILEHVLPVDQRSAAANMAGSLQASGIEGKSWLTSPVNLVRVVEVEDGGVEALYIEASNLVHPAPKTPIH